MHVVVTSIDPIVPDETHSVLAHVAVDLPDRGLMLHGLALVAAPKTPGGLAVLLPRHRRRSDGQWMPSVRFGARDDVLAIAAAVIAAWQNYREGGSLS